MREEMAKLCHDQWSGWMEYLFSKCSRNINDGGINMPSWAAERWKRQMKTKYEDLSEEEKDSDRKEADKFLELWSKAEKHAVEQMQEMQDVTSSSTRESSSTKKEKTK